MAALTNRVSYLQGSLEPDCSLFTTDDQGALYDFSSGWTLTAEVGKQGQAATFTETGVTGAAGSGTTTPNAVIVWTAGNLDTLPAGDYLLELVATDGAARTLRAAYNLHIRAGVGTS